MFNGHQTNGAYNTSRASLCNLVNTCYLNSVLYTLRYTPGFLRKCHHLVTDLQLINSMLYQTKHKSSSLGRNIPSLTGSSSRSNSSKDLLSLGNCRNEVAKPDELVIVDELHDLYLSMHNLEMKESSEPMGPHSFRDAFVSKYKTFRGSQQQDAHEFLVCLLSSINDTCVLMAKKIKEFQTFRENLMGGRISEKTMSSKESKSWSMPSWKKRRNTLLGNKDQTNEMTEEANNTSDTLDYSKLAINSRLIDDFEGITIFRTICLECETVTERKESFFDLCIPINGDVEETGYCHVFRDATVTSEYLTGSNKYYCENCFRYTEARRDVCYSKLPRILIIQLKRFMSSIKGTEKINYYMPTPLEIPCFCDECCDLGEGNNLHSYTLFSVIMHKGATMAEGHYVSFVRDLVNASDYYNCVQDHLLPNMNTTEKSQTNNRIAGFFKTKTASDCDSDIKNNVPTQTVCRSAHCCSIKSSVQTANGSSSVVERSATDSSIWLECNDEVIRVFSAKEFEHLLTDHNKVTSTPYLLFYVKSNV